MLVVAGLAHLVLRTPFRSPCGTLGPWKAQFAQERLRTTVRFHR
jgi:hypothetical protein